MARLEALVKVAKPKIGYLAEAATGLRFFEGEQDGWLVVWEEPISGCSYLGALDTCRHEQAEGAKDPDAHSFWMLRASFRNDKGEEVNTRAACRIRHPCRWDAAVLAEKIVLALKWYGDPMIVPEANQGLDVIDKLREAGCHIYRRKLFDRLNPGKTRKIIGWETTEKTRPLIVTALQEAIREEALDLECPIAVRQLRTFERNPRGKACAAAGQHDDDVISLGIGLVCIGSARRMPESEPLHFGHYGDGGCTFSGVGGMFS